MIKQDLSWIPESLEGHTLNIGGPANIGIAYRNYGWLHSFVHFGDLSNVVEDIRRLCTELDNGVCKNYVCYYSPRPADEEHAQLITDYRNFSYIHLPMLFLQQNSRCELLDVNTLPPIQTEFTKNFITLNNRIGPQRYEIFTYLRDNNLLDTGYVSYRNVYRDGPENLDSENHNWIIDKPYCNFNETITEYQGQGTAAKETYNASGMLETKQETIIATRNATFVQDTVNETTSRTDTTTSISSELMWIQGGIGDPLAQTFVCDQQGGGFITKIDLYFSSKDDNLPVWVEIRNVVNGYPGKKLLPFGRKVLEPADVNTSDTAATATTFTFDSPIYLKEGEEYCVVCMTQSLHYKLWISQMGETDVGGSRLVSDQPHLGVLFKSQNNSTWNAVQTQDMKFTIYRAEFDTTDGTLTFTNDNIGDSVTAEDGSTTVYGRRLPPNPLILENSSTVMKVRHTDHGHYSTSNNVTITGATSGITTTLDGAITASATSLTLTSATNFEASSLSSRCYVKIGDEIMYGTLSSTTISSLTRGDDGTTAAAHSDDATVELYQILKTPLTEINKTHTAVANIGIDYYTLTLTTAPTVSGASSTAEVGQTQVYATENYRMETIKTMLATFEPPNTTLSAKIRATTGTSPSGSETSFSTATTANAVSIPINENFEFDATQMVCSPINETNELGGSKSLFMPITLSTTKSNLSPVIDLDRKTLICVGNRMNNVDSSSDVYPTTDYRTSEEPEGDQNAFVYITKRVALENPATALKIFFAANRHSSAELKVLFKILRSDSAEDFDELSYQFFNTTGTTDNTTASSLDRDDLQQYVYTAGVTDDGIGDPLPEFIQFAIKIVGQGTNAAQPIRIRDLRCIALAT